jgi:hypothetical protein
MIGLPDEATDAELTELLEPARTKLDPDLAPALSVECFDEGTSAQIMHVGPYAQERPTIERPHAGIAETGLRARGRHHELWATRDARRPNPEDDLASNGGSSTPGVGTLRCPSGLGPQLDRGDEPCDGIPSAAVEACDRGSDGTTGHKGLDAHHDHVRG